MLNLFKHKTNDLLKDDDYISLQKVGDILCNARNAQHKDIDEVAASLKLRIEYIISLENGDWKKLPAETYAKGYLQKYCDLLEIENPLKTKKIDRRSEEKLSTPPNNTHGRRKNDKFTATDNKNAENELETASNRSNKSNRGTSTPQRAPSFYGALISKTKAEKEASPIKAKIATALLVLCISAGLYTIISNSEIIKRKDISTVKSVPERLMIYSDEQKYNIDYVNDVLLKNCDGLMPINLCAGGENTLKAIENNIKESSNKQN